MRCRGWRLLARYYSNRTDGHLFSKKTPIRDRLLASSGRLSRIGVSVAYTLEEKSEKSWNEPKTVVTLHRLSEQTTSERQRKEIEIKHLNNNN